MKNASPESCQQGWTIFKRKAELIPGARFGNVPSRVSWPTRLSINFVLVNEGFDQVSPSTYHGFRRLFREGRDYQTRNEIHYPGAPSAGQWEPVAFGTES